MHKRLLEFHPSIGLCSWLLSRILWHRVMFGLFARYASAVDKLLVGQLGSHRYLPSKWDLHSASFPSLNQAYQIALNFPLILKAKWTARITYYHHLSYAKPIFPRKSSTKIHPFYSRRMENLACICRDTLFLRQQLVAHPRDVDKRHSDRPGMALINGYVESN